MDFELFIIITLIIVFLVSCCGLIQKIKENYEEDRGRVISVTQIHVPNQAYNNNAYHNVDELSSGVYPAPLAPPPYLEHMEPPPRYEDLIKETQYTVIQMSQHPDVPPQAIVVNQNETEVQQSVIQMSQHPYVPPQAIFVNQNETEVQQSTDHATPPRRTTN